MFGVIRIIDRFHWDPLDTLDGSLKISLKFDNGFSMPKPPNIFTLKLAGPQNNC